MKLAMLLNLAIGNLVIFGLGSSAGLINIGAAVLFGIGSIVCDVVEYRVSLRK